MSALRPIVLRLGVVWRWKRTVNVITALNFGSFAIWKRKRDRPELQDVPVVAMQKGRVVACCTLAASLGVEVGMSIPTAMSKSPEIEFVNAVTPELEAAWQLLVEDLAELTTRLEPPYLGLVYLELEPYDAQQLAEEYGVQVGLAHSLEYAFLASTLAAPGSSQRIDLAEQQVYVNALPVTAFKGLGLTGESLQKLSILGIQTFLPLRRWSRPQLRAFLGYEQANLLLPFLSGPCRTTLSCYTPPPRIAKSVQFDEALSEPWQLGPYLQKLSAEVTEALGGRSSQRLRLVAESMGIANSSTRVLKTPIREASETFRLAQLALDDTHAQSLGIDALTLELSQLSRPSQQTSLFKQKENIEKAVSAVERRYPRAILKITEVDPYALASNLRYRITPRVIEHA